MARPLRVLLVEDSEPDAELIQFELGRAPRECIVERVASQEAMRLAQAEGIGARVVSTPCWELFEAQTDRYKAAVIGESPVRVAVEAAIGFGWERFIGEDGVFVGMTGYGASAPAERLYQEFGITAEAVAAAAKAKLA